MTFEIYFFLTHNSHTVSVMSSSTNVYVLYQLAYTFFYFF